MQPFGNTLVVKTCTGQQIYDVLNQQFNNPAPGSNRIMLPSANVQLPVEHHHPRRTSSTDRCPSTEERRPSTRAGPTGSP